MGGHTVHRTASTEMSKINRRIRALWVTAGCYFALIIPADLLSGAFWGVSITQSPPAHQIGSFCFFFAFVLAIGIAIRDWRGVRTLGNWVVWRPFTPWHLALLLFMIGLWPFTIAIYLVRSLALAYKRRRLEPRMRELRIRLMEQEMGV